MTTRIRSRIGNEPSGFEPSVGANQRLASGVIEEPVAFLVDCHAAEGVDEDSEVLARDGTSWSPSAS